MLEEEFLEAVAKGDTQRVVRLLGQTTSATTSDAANCSLPTKNGQNALHIAAQVGNTDIVSVLLLSGLYNCNTSDSAGYTALQIASAEGRLEIVKLLIKTGANVNLADKVHGNTALHEASWKGYSQTIAQLAKEKADLNIKNWGGFTALHLCCQKGHNQSCRELLIAGCDPDIQNNYGDTALHTSARYGHAGVMRILISAQCRISDQNKNGDTALHIAAAMSHRKLTRILLEAGCNKCILNKQNETAEDIAIRKSLVEIVDILRNINISQIKVKTSEKVCHKVVDIPPVKVKKSSKDKHNKKDDEKHAAKRKNTHVSAGAKKEAAVPWSPYGCHYYPDASDFPEPKLDTLPSDPLKKGEQYYLDLAGNIRKGPIGVGYTCYCAPFFKQLESHLDKKTKQLKKRINEAEENINERLKTVEQNLNLKRSSIPATVAQDNRRSFHVLGNNGVGNNYGRHRGADVCNKAGSRGGVFETTSCTSPVLRTRSLEYIFDDEKQTNAGTTGSSMAAAADNPRSEDELLFKDAAAKKDLADRLHLDDKDDSVVSYKFGNRSLNETKPALVVSRDDASRYGKYFGSTAAKQHDSSVDPSDNCDFRVTHLPYCRDLNSNKCESMYSLSLYKDVDINKRIGYANSAGGVSSSSSTRRLFNKHPLAACSRITTAPSNSKNKNNNNSVTNVWSKSCSKPEESCGSSNEEDNDDDDCDPVTDAQCNDSGYSTKMCSNSQGPSPSLSGRTENDGVLSNASSQDSKQMFGATVYPYHHRHRQSISIGAASIV